MRRCETVLVIVALAGSGALAGRLQFGRTDARAGVEVIEQTNTRTTFVVRVPYLDTTSVTTDSGTFVRLSVPAGYPAGLDSARPEVPAITALLAVPTGCACTTSVVISDPLKLQVADVYPQQPWWCDTLDSAPFFFDRAFYGTNSEGHSPISSALSQAGIGRGPESRCGQNQPA